MTDPSTALTTTNGSTTTPVSTTTTTWNTHPHWLGFPAAPSGVHVTLGVILIVLGIAGVLGNTLVLVVFTRFRRLRGPFSAFIVNLAMADLLTSLLHMMVAASSFNEGWLFGSIGCQCYAFGVGLSGMNSIITLTAIAIERYMVITAKPLSANWRVSQVGAQKIIGVIWLYCFFLTVPPLIGWSQYIQEGFMTSCSWDYISRTPMNRAYYIYLLTFGFFLPVAVIAYCYIFIMAAIISHGREMRTIEANGGGAFVACSHHSSGAAQAVAKARSSKIANTFRSAYIIIMLVILFLVSWTPYAVVTLIAQFGDVSLINPWAATLPALFAKASVVYNPIVYGLSHPYFRSTVKQYMTTVCRTGATFGGGRTSGTPVNRRPKRTFELQEYRPTRPNATPARSVEIPVRCCHRAGTQQAYFSEPANDQGAVLIMDRRPLDTMVNWQPEPAQASTSRVRRSISGPPRGEVCVTSSAHIHDVCCNRGRICSLTAGTSNQASLASRHFRRNFSPENYEIV